MRVELVQATQDAGKLIADIASICYGKEEAKNPERLLRNLFKLGHTSTFEHIYYTFKVEGISRINLSQLTRHRHASFTVRSSRYCSESEQEYITPGSIQDDNLSQIIWTESLELAKRTYENMIERGIKREDARFILPQALSTDLYMSCNLRELIHIADLRISQAAQWEIRELVERMVEVVLEISPELAFMFKEGD